MDTQQQISHAEVVTHLEALETAVKSATLQKGTDKILGATIVATHAGDMINEITLAMVHNLGLGKISSVIHSYPTQAEAIRKAADAYRRTLLTPRTEAVLKFLMRLPS